MPYLMEVNFFTVRPENAAEFLDRRPAMLEAIRRHYPGFIASYLGRLSDDRWTDVAFWQGKADCDLAVEEAPKIPEVAAWLALIQPEDATMQFAESHEAPLLAPPVAA